MGDVVTTAWFDKIKTCVGWDVVDRARLAKLRRSLASECPGVIETLGKRLAQFKDTESLMANARFVERLHEVLEEWLMGLLNGTFDREYVEKRWGLGQRLFEVHLSFEDLILAKTLARRLLSDLAQERMEGQDQAFHATMHSLDKALCLDTTLIHHDYLQVREAEQQRLMLDRFLAITGFSRTLYENLAEAREWSGVDLRETELS